MFSDCHRCTLKYQKYQHSEVSVVYQRHRSRHGQKRDPVRDEHAVHDVIAITHVHFTLLSVRTAPAKPRESIPCEFDLLYNNGYVPRNMEKTPSALGLGLLQNNGDDYAKRMQMS